MRLVFLLVETDKFELTLYEKIITFFSLSQPAFSFLATVVVCVCMYRHMDRLNAFRERLDKEGVPKPKVVSAPQPPPPANLNVNVANNTQQTYPQEWNLPPQQQMNYQHTQNFPPPNNVVLEDENLRWQKRINPEEK